MAADQDTSGTDTDPPDSNGPDTSGLQQGFAGAAGGVLTDLKPGDTLDGKYLIISKIAETNFSEVYRAKELGGLAGR